MKVLKPYMVFSRELGSGEAAYLVFAHSSREAKVVGYDGEIAPDWLDLGVRLVKDGGHLYREADPEKLKSGIPHSITSPITCKGCNFWGYPLNNKGYCEDCFGELNV